MKTIHSAEGMLAVIKEAVRQSTTIVKKYQDADETVCRLRVVSSNEGTFTVINEDENPLVPFSMRYDELNLLTDVFLVESEYNPFTDGIVRVAPPKLPATSRDGDRLTISSDQGRSVAVTEGQKGTRVDTQA